MKRTASIPSRVCMILTGFLIAAPLLAAEPAAKPNEPAHAKILLVGTDPDHGPGEHEYMQGLKIIQSCLKPMQNVEAIVIKGWPTAEQFKDAKAMLLFCANGGSFVLAKPERREQFRGMIRLGMGFGTVHYACDMDAPHEKELSDDYLSILGAYYETGYSHNPVNRLLLRPVNFPHPTTRGLEAFTTEDETYYKLRFMPRTEPYIVAKIKDPDGEFDRCVAWTYSRPEGGRSFGFTGAHYHREFKKAPFRRLIVNGTLWIAGVEVPPEGGPIDCDEALFVAPPRK